VWDKISNLEEMAVSLVGEPFDEKAELRLREVFDIVWEL
jgi:hypothetical protein